VILALLPMLALAGGPGFYHPADVAGSSALYAKAADHAGTTFNDLSSNAEAVAEALSAYEEGLDLLGPAAPAGERARLDELRTSFNRERAQLEAFAGYMIEDFDAVFVASLERGVNALGGELTECEAMIPMGPSMPGIRPRYEANPACAGEDVNAKLSALMDSDPILRKEIDEILRLEWPAITIPAAPQPVIGGAERYVGVRPLMRQGANAAMTAIDRADEDARLPFEAAIEDEASLEERARLVQEAKLVTAKTAAARAQTAAPVLAAASAALEKWAKKGEPATGWCANPELLGGCDGDDATVSLLPRLLDDKKVQKALP
jgi:hypothetical protein